MGEVLDEIDPLFTALQTHDISSAKRLLEEGANPNRLLINGVTPFHFAVGASSSFSEDFINLILQHNGDPNVCDSNGLTPLHVAAIWGKAHLLLLLLQNGADIAQQDEEGKTARQYAVENGNSNCLIILNEFDQTFQFSTTQVYPNQSNHRNNNTCPMCRCTPNRFNRQCPDQTKNVMDTGTVPDTNLNHSDNGRPTKSPYKVCIDATSPDNCYSFQTPKKRQISFSNLEKTVIQPQNFSSESGEEISDCSYDSASSHLSVMKENLSENENFSTPKLNAVFNIDESKRRILLQSTKLNINGDSNKSMSDNVTPDAPLYESVETQDSIYTIAESTVPLENSLLSTPTHVNDTSHFSNHSIQNVTGIETLHSDLEINSSFYTKAETQLDIGKMSELEQKYGIDNVEEDDTICLYSDSDGDSFIEHMCRPAPSLSPSNVSRLSCYSTTSGETTVLYDWKSFIDGEFEELSDHFSPDEALEVVIPPEVYKLSDNELRTELIRFGFTVGPIAPGRKLYQRRLTLLRQGVNLNDAKTLNLDMLYSQELRCFLIGKPTPPTVYEDDQILRLEFDNPDPSLGLREGNNKDCFNYLLLDPRVTKKLPSRASQLSEVECLNIFCGAVFYVGKGKRSRPYAHFKEAIRSDPLKHPSAKVKHILDIWKCNCGVISLNVFQNVIPSEAYTREAAMIATLGLQHLTNCVRGNCYGSASKWSLSRLRSYGAYLLLSAMRIMLLEGERQIRSTQILNQTKRKT